MTQPVYVCPTCGARLKDVEAETTVECSACGLSGKPIQATRPIAKPVRQVPKHRELDPDQEPMIVEKDLSAPKIILWWSGCITAALGMTLIFFVLVLPTWVVDWGMRLGNGWTIGILLVAASAGCFAWRWYLIRLEPDSENSK